MILIFLRSRRRLVSYLTGTSFLDSSRDFYFLNAKIGNANHEYPTINAKLLIFVLVIFGQCLTSGYGCRKKDDGKSHPTPASTKVTTVPVGGGEKVARLTPEQVSNSLVQALDLHYGADDGAGNFYDYVVNLYGVTLGGVNFLGGVRVRDRFTKAQTLLITRRISWLVAQLVVEREAGLTTTQGSLFTKCSMQGDHPNKSEASLRDWTAQIHDFYRRLFSREASSEEIALIAKSFEAILAEPQGTQQGAWHMTLYSIISSMETWNTWQ